MAAAGSHAPFTLAIGPVTVTFTWATDRWSHRVTLRGGSAWDSVEGSRPEDGDDRWPASPVLVELSQLQTAHGPAILGVGLAGRSHFSASIGADPHHPDRVRFEIACRCNEPPVWLGSCYDGHGGRVAVRPGNEPPCPPATVQWGYSVGVEGITATDGSVIARPLPPRQG